MRLGVDFGGTKIEAALLDSNGEIRVRQRVPNPGNYDAAVRILGTGCGGGVVVDGRTIEGANAIGGEWGHTPLPWARADEVSVRDWCGRWNCLEQWVSGSGLRRWSGIGGRDLDAGVKAGDAHARVVLDQLADRLARSLAVVMDILDPDAIVFGGGLSNIDALYPSVRGKLIAHVFSDVIRTNVVKNKHGDSSGVRGAAWLFTPEEAQ
ncbi:MAG: ROK family protein [Proteobacteria bacterium]|nr:ROK family protein [Pseudomonadota bacterium]